MSLHNDLHCSGHLNNITSNHDPLNDIDPDVNMLANENTVTENTNYFTTEQFCDINKNINSLSFINANVRSLVKNFDTFKIFLFNLKYSFSFLACTENWLKKKNVSLYNIDGYIHEYNLRHKRQGGGVSLFIKNTISYTVRSDITLSESYNCLAIEVFKEYFNTNKNVIIIVIYRPPSTQIKNFNDEFQHILEKITNENKLACILGDYNVNTFIDDDPNNKDVTEFSNLFLINGFIKLITKPTRIYKNKRSLLDNIYTNLPVHIDSCQHGIIISDFSDHFAVFAIFSKTYSLPLHKYRKHRNFNDKNIHRFKIISNNKSWSDIYNTNSAQNCYAIFHSYIQNLFNDCFPEKEVKIKYENKHDWLTNAILNSIKHKNSLYYKCKKNPSPENVNCYKKYKNQLTSTLRHAERKFYSDQLQLNKYDLKETWRVMKNIIGARKSYDKPVIIMHNEEKIIDSTKIAHIFNDYFTNVGSDLAKHIQSNINPLSYINTTLYSISIPQFTEGEILNVIKSLKNSSAGYDFWPTKVGKKLAPSFLKPLTYIINKSFTEGVFPDELKIGKIIPIFKSGSCLEVNNYRPITVLSFFSKIFEKVAYIHLINFINKHNLLYKYQFGFRREHSTSHALITLVNEITKALDEGNLMAGVFIDLKKAFDTVNHSILLRKLYAYGIRGSMHDWLKSYLTNRMQYTHFQKNNSTKKRLVSGVPQGSILGPLLFIIYVNDLHRALSDSYCIIFADDTNVFIKHKNYATMMDCLNNDLYNIAQWLKANKLILNIKKTHYMLFHRSRIKNIHSKQLSIDNIIINKVTNTKFLGVILDQTLSWSYHANYIQGKLSKGAAIIYKARKNLPKSSLITLYNSFVFPYLIYCVEVWGNASNFILDPIYKIQKRVIRTITYSPYRSSTDILFSKLNILPLNILVMHRIGIFMHKIYLKLSPKCIINMFTCNSEIHNHNTRQRYHLHIKKSNHEYVYRSFIYQGVYIWNLIIDNIEFNVSIPKFKHVLKKFLASTNIPLRYSR